jgi:hypothetical protein
MQCQCIISNELFRTQTLVDARLDKVERKMAPFTNVCCISNGPNLGMKQSWVATREFPAPSMVIMKNALEYRDTECRIYTARSTVVVEALCYKPEGRGFEAR